MEGYIKIHRQITENKYYLSETFTRTQAWMDLLILAQHKPKTVRLKGVVVDLKRGQLCWSIKSLAERWQWSQGKVDRFLNELETESQTVSKNLGVTTLISILNYDLYQTDGEQKRDKTGSRRGADGEQTGTNNNVKNVNNTIPNGIVYSDQQKNDFEKFIKFIADEAEDVAKMREPITIAQFLKLKEKFDSKLIASVLRDMDNKVGLAKDYKSAYSTCLSWCKRRLVK